MAKETRGALHHRLYACVCVRSKQAYDEQKEEEEVVIVCLLLSNDSGRVD